MVRIHTKRDIVTSIIIATSVVMISISLEYYIGESLKKYYYLFGIAAILLFISKGIILKKLQDGTIAHLLVDVFAVIFLFLFVKQLLILYINNALAFLIVGILLFALQPILTKSFVPEG